MDELEKLTTEYRKQFNDVVPIMELGSISKEELIKLIKNAIKKNAPIEIEYVEGREY